MRYPDMNWPRRLGRAAGPVEQERTWNSAHQDSTSHFQSDDLDYVIDRLSRALLALTDVRVRLRRIAASPGAGR